ncbi:pimeloyl-ACP methyl ester esterase BioH [Kaarinaea lacus]
MSLFVQAKGVGPDLVLLHGWGMNADVWEDVVNTLSTDHRVTTVDLPGHGRSSNDLDDYSLENLAKTVAEAVPAGSVLAGWSLGGLVATQMVLDYPDRFKKLILVSSAPQFVKDEGWPDGMEAEVLNSFAGDLQEDYRKTVSRFIAIQAMGSDNPRDEQRVLRDRVFRHGDPDLSALIGGLNILHNANLRPELPDIQCPTLLLIGDNDTLYRTKAAEQTSNYIKNAKLSVIKGAGHAPFLSHQHEFLTELKSFL